MKIKEIAEICGVSVATVSRVVNKDQRVAETTRKKVLQVIDKYNYVPNITGRSLRTQKTNRILVLLPTMDNQFYTSIIQGIEDKAEENGYTALVAVTDLEEEKELKYLQMLKMNHVDGCISFFNTLGVHYINELAKKYPFVQCCELTIGADVSHVVIDNKQAVYDITSEFINQGCLPIALISGDYYKYSEMCREAGYMKALKEHDLEVDKDLIVKNFYRYTDGSNAVKTIFSKGYKPSAIVCASDSLALGAIDELKRMGLNVGKDILVTGFDNTSITEFYHPTISSIAQPRYDLGREAFNLLLEKIKDIESTNKRVILPYEIIHRGSTGRS